MSAPLTASSPWSGCAQITRGWPDPTPGRPPVPAAVQVLDRPLLHLSTDHRDRRHPAHPTPQTGRV